MTQSAAVAKHYGEGDLTRRLPGILQSAGLGSGPVDWSRLTGFDQFHARGLLASKELADGLQLQPGDHVLDVGSGVGGPARFLAATCGVRVTGIDLTPDFVSAATLLSEHAGLSGKTQFVQGDALDMRSPDASFDHAWTQHVAMNIPDKARLYREVHRVLKPRGRFGIYDIVRGPAGDPHYPLPWAADASFSFLATPAEMRELLTNVGFRELSFEDKTQDALRWLADLPNTPPAGLTLHDLVGPEWQARFANFAQSLKEQKLGLLQAILEKG
ncbi:MAG: class I SAM-dependent methyltransferase [Acidobacteriales bacterium]|nr:class I SAM-dependent methyltransferase [Terriglobales bacterium]